MEEVRPSVENRKLMVAIDGTSVTVPEIEPKSKQQNNTCDRDNIFSVVI
jgi:hypothetical protein